MSARRRLPLWNDASQNVQRPLSDQSKKWIYSLAKIKFQIDRAVHVETDHILNAVETAGDPFPFPGREEEYQRWADDIKERASRPHPITENEASSFVTDSRGLWIWQAVYHSFLTRPSRDLNRENVAYRKSLSSPFANMALHLLETALTVKSDELSLLSDIIDAIDLQLSMLCVFGELYGLELNPSGYFQEVGVPWRGDLRGKIRKAEKQAREEENSQPSRLTRPPAQHAQDNFLLQTMIGVALLASVYPLYRAMGSSLASGSVLDSDFWQQIINAIVQLAGFVTLLLPIYRETSAQEWIGTWILTTLGICSALSTIPLYIFAPGLLSVFFSWLASATQLLVVLQVALVATFHTQQHTKKE